MHSRSNYWLPPDVYALLLAVGWGDCRGTCRREGLVACITMVRVGWSQDPLSASSIIILLTTLCTCAAPVHEPVSPAVLAVVLGMRQAPPGTCNLYQHPAVPGFNAKAIQRK